MAEAASPDADRALTEVSAYVPEWVVHLLARLILFLCGQSRTAAYRRAPGAPAWRPGHPDRPPGSLQATLLRGGFGHAAAWMWRRCGIDRRRPDRPVLAGSIVTAFSSRLLGCNSVPRRAACHAGGARTSCPASTAMQAATPAADTVIMFLPPKNDDHAPPPVAVAPARPYGRCDHQSHWH